MANVVITGASRGLGFAMLRTIAEQPPIKPLTILACARNPPASNDFKAHPDVTIQWHKLDIIDPQNILDFAAAAKEQCPDGIDILINNAGVALDQVMPHGIEASSQALAVNHDGGLAMTQALLPAMRRPGLEQLGGKSRIVGVTSVAAKILRVDDAKLQRFHDAKTFEDVQALRDEYLDSVRAGTEEQQGWPKGRSYNISKGLVNATTQAVAAMHPDLLVNCGCPGWFQSDMGRIVGNPPKTAEEGARIPLRLAFGPIELSGKYWENTSVTDKGYGEPVEWAIPIPNKPDTGLPASALAALNKRAEA